jgi:hypothetical protein
VSRLVEARPRAETAHGAATFRGTQTSVQQRVKDYGERVAKFVPAEVLAFYSCSVQLIMTKTGPANGEFRLWAFSIVGVIGWVVTPIWLGTFSTDPATRRPNQIMGFLAFLIWAYAYPAGAFAELGIYDPVIGGLVLLTFTLLSGFFQPRK